MSQTRILCETCGHQLVYCKCKAPIGSMLNPYTHGGQDMRHKVCKCGACGLVAECTPLADFYFRADSPKDGLLFCVSCLLELGFHKRETEVTKVNIGELV